MSDALAIPLRVCEWWCPQGEGHPDQHPVDRDCVSEMVDLPLSRHEPVRMSGGEWWRDWLTVYLRREVADAEPHVRLSWETEPKGIEIELTIEEARMLLDLLTDAIALGSGVPGAFTPAPRTALGQAGAEVLRLRA